MGWAVASIALIATACGGGSGESAAGDDDGPTSFEDIEYKSPIAEFLGQDLDFNSEDSQAEFEAQAREVEQKVAACMAEEGFEYTPVDQSQYTAIAVEEELPYFSDEWVAKYGFGITTQRFSQSMLNDELVGYEDSVDTTVAPPEDANAVYAESLSPAEQEAYYAALYGDQPEFDENATEEEMNEAYENFVPTGCQNTAWEELNGGSQGFYQEFSDDLQEMYERMEADPAVTKYRDEVTACVAEEGLVYTNQDDLYSQWEDDLASLDPFSSGGDPFEGTGLNPEEMSQEELDEFFREANKFDEEALAKLAELQAEELELARVVIECGGGPLKEEVVLSDVRVALEQEFLDANADRIAEYENSAAGS